MPFGKTGRDFTILKPLQSTSSPEVSTADSTKHSARMIEANIRDAVATTKVTCSSLAHIEGLLEPIISTPAQNAATLEHVASKIESLKLEIAKKVRDDSRWAEMSQRINGVDSKLDRMLGFMGLENTQKSKPDEGNESREQIKQS